MQLEYFLYRSLLHNQDPIRWYMICNVIFMKYLLLSYIHPQNESQNLIDPIFCLGPV